MKTAIVTAVTCIECACPHCGGECVGSRHGSLTMISEHDETVYCLQCEQTSKVPLHAFRAHLSALERVRRLQERQTATR
jgi:hypothetical protein